MEQAQRTGSPYDDRELPSGVPTVSEFLDRCWDNYVEAQKATKTWKEGTRATYATLMPAVREHYGSKRFDRIAQADHLALARKHPQRNYAVLVRVVFCAALKLGEIESLPPLPDLPTPRKTTIQPPTTEEVRLLFAASSDYMTLVIGLGAWAGLRSCESRALRVGDVDFPNERILVRHSFSGRGPNQEEDDPKDREPRIVPIAPQLMLALREACRNKLPGAWLLASRRGVPPSYDVVRERLSVIARQCGLSRQRTHALRHYFCSALVRGGASVEAIRALAGHSDLRQTQEYVHAVGDDLRNAISRLAGQ